MGRQEQSLPGGTGSVVERIAGAYRRASSGVLIAGADVSLEDGAVARYL